MKKTTNYGLNLPEANDITEDLIEVDDLNYNAEIIDEELAKKLEKPKLSVGGNLAEFDETGNLIDSGVKTSEAGGAAVIKEHVDKKDNPHAVTKSQVGLGKVDNTSDMDKPVSIRQQEAINLAGRSYVWFATVSTAVATAAKKAVLDGMSPAQSAYVQQDGAVVYVTLTGGNTAISPTLAVEDSAALAIVSVTGNKIWAAGQVLMCIKKGDTWLATDISSDVAFYGPCSIAAGTDAKTCPAAYDSRQPRFTLKTGAMALVFFQYGSTSTQPTLNVAGTGAYGIEITNGGSFNWHIRFYGLFVFDKQYSQWNLINAPAKQSTMGLNFDFSSKHPNWTEKGGTFVYGASGLEESRGSTIGSQALTGYNIDVVWSGKILEIPVSYYLNNTWIQVMYKIDSRTNNSDIIKISICLMSNAAVIGVFNLEDRWANNVNATSSIVVNSQTLYTTPESVSYNGLLFTQKVSITKGTAKAVVNGSVQTNTAAVPDMLIDKIAVIVAGSGVYPVGYYNVQSIQIGSL